MKKEIQIEPLPCRKDETYDTWEIVDFEVEKHIKRELSENT